MGQTKPNRLYLYQIEIFKPSDERADKAEKYSVFFSKNYGDMHGGVFGCESIAQVKESLKGIVKAWERYDSILGRTPDKVTRHNLYFESFTTNITISDVLGIQTLSDWM